MKNTALIILISILTITGSNSQQEVKFTENDSVPDFYRQYSSFTNPGEYAYLYKNLPDSLPELCKLIKSQFIHPYAELPKYSDSIPKERWKEAEKYPTVKSILEGLLSYDPQGLIENRKLGDRLILTCRQNAILLASILKYRGIPTRVRVGHATYLIPDFHVSHVICEVWNKNENRWMLVDPSMDMVDFSKDKFDFSNDAWLQLQQKEIDPNLFGIPGKYSGHLSIVAKINSDLAFILGTEYTVYQYSNMLKYAFENNNQLADEHIEILNSISKLMKTLDAKNLRKLQEIYDNTPEIHITRSFLSEQKPKNSTNENTVNQSISKPNIEFVDIPGGTFTMGSPTIEYGRKNDEIQHKVTVNSFKMSKYTITVEQYNLFCKATDKKKPWYGPYRHDNNSVTQITWYNAQAFAEWMGCRLPTEAEFEYATRANTITPFYTGDCLTTNQANFNGKKPYKNCEKGINRNKPIPVGSFSPNAFGLYDMHGNMLEWCSDWYGKYIIEDKLNPKGPETGTLKVARGGGWFEPTRNSRSACRGGGIPPGNRGAGISFRIVKDL
ncbi:SUMF1/EgtB/PvdO family nonheme iron enzyme [Flavivirga abyssicola]|uniref:SUMF1/EgtB/PvdO family nonheme iron enzyme n=1 Tax=Flavivirga abyssicola TaxID=3063533 RepID=UPI0026E04590|nr:SUMF1/EgtB/PvdO family nonheme iron enzyme [Flavivirga sp. MEBiC07777]WVK14237.1 SUMF1/EgtB/PvdO family nonheme iron enzyme [Flavivirga sp. MEBiC07777]